MAVNLEDLIYVVLSQSSAFFNLLSLFFFARLAALRETCRNP